MAMKVTKTAITRLSVIMGCSCQMYAEFKDVQCKEPFNPLEGEGGATYIKVFHACGTHGNGDPGLPMLQFIIGERLDEAVNASQASQATPVQSQHTHVPPEVSMGNDGSLMQSVGKVNNLDIVRLREKRDPLAIKTSTTATTRTPDIRMDIQGAKENEDITSNLEEMFTAIGGEAAEG